MKKLIITTCVVLSMAVLPMSNASAGCNWNSQQQQWVGNCSDGGGSAPTILNNVNRNNNYNNNRNTNVQGQTQRQGQHQSVNNTNDVSVNVNIDNSQSLTNSQAQGQVQGQKQGDGATNDTSDTRDLAGQNISMRGVRGFATPAEINHVAVPSYFGAATKNSNVQPAETMVMYKDTYTRAEVEKYLNVVRIDHNREGEFMSWSDKKADQTIKVVLTPPAKGTVVQTALITTKAKNADTESKDVLYSALLSGLDSGADLLLITAEGAGTVMKSFGWGLGMSYTRSTLSADEQTGGVSAGGLGISGGSAGYKSLPWIQAIGLKLVK